VVICPSCGQENPEGFAFCGRCGTALATPAQRAQQEERKVVTVLFCDLVGFTSRSERADPEDVRATLRTYHDRVRREIERRGGTVEKFIGDAVMAVFGAPTAHEDDAERAVRAGLQILEAIVELNEEHPGLGLSVRVGINTGEAVVTLGANPAQGEAMVAGDVVNTAARLQSAAPQDAVVVGALTERITRDHIDYQPLEPATAKGKAEPLPLWRAVQARGRYGVDVDQRTRSPFIGRGLELDLLHRTFVRSVDEQSLQLVTITGEPGVGKSRLLWELKTRMDDDPTLTVYWRQGRCLPYGEGITFWALGEIVKGLAGVLESDGPDQAAEKLDAALRGFVEDHDEHPWLREKLRPLLGMGGVATDQAPGGAPASDREESYAAWRRFLESAAARHPLVLVFEDLHWADPALIGFVDHLVDWSNGVPITVICTARPELYERHPGWGGGKRNSSTIALSPLSDEETARLLGGLLEQAVLPAELQSALLDRAGGNPLYAEEFVRMLRDRGALQPHGRTLRLAPGVAAEAIELPDTIQAIISARLDTLSPERKSLLQDASVVGKVFWSGAVASMSGSNDERAVRDGLHELARKELVRPMRSSSVKDQSEFAFWHALVRDVAYGQIPRADRARRHREAAEWIERMAGDRVGDQAELLVHHYEQALALSLAAGGIDEATRVGLEGQLVRFLELAGDKAARLDMVAAWTFYRRALDRMGLADPHRPEVTVKAMALADEAGMLPFDEVEAGYRQAIEAFREGGDIRRGAMAMRQLASTLRVQGHTRQARETLWAAKELLEREPPGPELAVVYSAIAGNEMLATNDPESFLPVNEKGIELAQRFDLAPEIVRGLQLRGIGRVAVGDAVGLEDMAEGVRIGLERGVGAATMGPAFVNLADWTGIYGDPARSLEIYQQGIEFGLKRGAGRPVSWARAETTWRLFDLGRWDELIEVTDVVTAWEDSHRGRAQPGVISSIEKAHVLGLRGRHDEARDIEDWVLPRARDIADPQILWQAMMVFAVARSARGEVDGAMSLVRELTTASAIDTRMRAFWLVPEAVRVLIDGGDVGVVRELVDDRVLPVPSYLAKQVLLRAVLAEVDGDLDAALDGYGEAGRWFEEHGYAYEHAHALLAEGRCLLGLGRVGEATGALGEARQGFGRLDAEPLVAAADDLLGEGTALTS
jgi:class 3 adenylate cyclase/tetratricopeptide (TPR) repeat protein